MHPVIQGSQNYVGQLVFPNFDYQGMERQTSLMATIRQYPQELLFPLRGIHISDEDGEDILQCMKHSQAYAGSDGSVKDGQGGHAFCITDNKFSKTI